MLHPSCNPADKQTNKLNGLKRPSLQSGTNTKSKDIKSSVATICVMNNNKGAVATLLCVSGLSLDWSMITVVCCIYLKTHCINIRFCRRLLLGYRTESKANTWAPAVIGSAEMWFNSAGLLNVSWQAESSGTTPWVSITMIKCIDSLSTNRQPCSS